MLQRTLVLGIAILMTTLSTFAADEKKPSAYPPSRVEKVVDKLHGVEVPDPYRWLEDGNAAEVKEWTEKQNAFTKTLLDKLPGRDIIRERLNNLLDIGSIGAPAVVKGRFFYTKRDGKQNQPVLYVREGMKGKDRVLLDPNTLSTEGTVALDWWYPSRDGKLLAYGLSKDGSEQSVLHVRNVDDGKDLPDVIERTRACSVAWLPDSKGFYYTRYPKADSVPKGEENYHRHVYLHQLGSDPAKDSKVFGEGRPMEDWSNVNLSPDGRWLVVTQHKGWAMTEVYFKDLQKPDSTFQTLIEKTKAIFEVTVRNDRFYVRSNDKAPRYRLYQVDPLKPARDQWKEIIAEGHDVLEGIAAIGDHLVANFMVKASSRLRLFDRDGKLLQEIKLPTLGSVAGIGGEWDGQEVFYGFQSVTLPQTIYRFDFNWRKIPGIQPPPEIWEQVKADIDFNAYEVQQVTYKSKDGTPITMFLAHKKGLKQDGNNPTVLYGYGGFNISLTPSFNPARFLFLERGGILAVANLRGGGEYGEEWHETGMLGKKQNVFDDFIAAGEWLIQEKWTKKDRLAILGGSNGGLLVGAALTQRPDLCKAVVCQVPLLDMVRYHKFLIARLWIPEYGSADEPEQFKWLHAYSPYHRVKSGTAYPAVLLATAESDTRVDALHARKMAALLQMATSSTMEQPILLRLEPKAGHGQGKPRGKVLDELTDVWSFLFWQLRIKA